jgi:chemotaxis protein MotB
MDSVKRAVGIHPERGGQRPDLGDSGHSTIDEIEHLEAVQEQMTIALQNYPNSGITMKIDDRGLVISLSAAKFFSSGESEIAPSQLPVLDAVIKTIAPLANLFEIDGFTDSVPMQSGQFHDNWELSAARAAVVLRYLLAHSAMTPDRFEIAGYGPYRAVGDNSTEEGRALNRRVEIVVKPVLAKS